MMFSIFVLASLGILDSGYLSYVHLFGDQACGPWAGCSFVLSSSYSRVFEVPVSTIGLGAYLCLAFLSLCARETQKRTDAACWIFYIALAGNLFAGYLIYLQALVIQHWCPFCLLSMLLMFSILNLVIWQRVFSKGIMLLLRIPNWRFGLKPMLVMLILPSVIFICMEQAIGVISVSAIVPKAPKHHDVAARFGDRTITLEEVDHGIRLGLNQIEWKRYEMRLLWIENELMSMTAAQQGLSVEQLKKQNIDDLISISEEEIKKVYELNKKGPLSKIPYEKAKEKISALLKTEKKKVQGRKYLDELKKHYNASFLIPRPLSLAIDDNPRQGPEKGLAGAVLTIVIFTDFECPFCKRAYKMIMDLLKRYPQDVRIVFRHRPLNIHENAHNAAYAATCAHLQGKFWPYADLLFKEQGKLVPAKLYEYAEEVGLDMEIFKHCMESERGKKIVDADIAEGNELGIFTTPGFFFNGHFVRGLPKPRQIQLILDQYLPKPDKQKPRG